MEIQTRIYDTFGMTKDQRMMSSFGFLSGPNGLQMQLAGTPDRVVQFEDFTGKTISGMGSGDWVCWEKASTATTRERSTPPRVRPLRPCARAAGRGS